MAADAVEHELKFSVAASFVLPHLGGDGCAHTSGPRRTLVANYWDTPDLRLTRRGHSLRHRRADDASEDTWTLKLAGAASGRALARREINRPGGADAPPAVIVGALRAIVGSQPLEFVCRLRSDRQTSYVVDEDGARLAEVEDDHVTVLGDHDEPIGTFHEIEIELVGEGEAADLEAIAGRMRRAGAPRPDPVTKVARALGELARRPVSEPVTRDVTVEQLVAHALRDALERLLAHDPAVRLELGPEGVHQARVSTRRLRADLRTLRPLLDADVVEPLREELAWVGACLGEVRDLDVLAVEVRDAAARVAEPLDLPAILTLIDRHRADAQRALIEAMSSERYAALLRRLEGAAAVPPLQADISPLRPAKPLARRLLRKSWKRLQRLADGVDDASPAEAWHEIRKKAKGTRYAGELLEPFLGKDAARLADAAKQVQDELGRANDAINARRWLREHAITPASAYVAGRLDPVFDTGGGDVHRRWPQTWRPVVQAAKRI